MGGAGAEVTVESRRKPHSPISSRCRSPLPSPFPLQGQPLYFKTFVGGSEESLKLQLAAYAAMDIVEEKLSDRKALVARLAQETAAGGAGGAAGGAAAAAAAGAKDSFLGMLMPVDEYKM